MIPALLLAILAALAGNALMLRRVARAVARLEARKGWDDVLADVKARTLAELEAVAGPEATPTGRPALRLVRPPRGALRRGRAYGVRRPRGGAVRRAAGAAVGAAVGGIAPLFPQLWREDIEAEARLAAWRAAQAFDPGAGIPFSAYVGQRVRWAVLHFVERELGPALRFFPGALRAAVRSGATLPTGTAPSWRRSAPAGRTSSSPRSTARGRSLSWTASSPRCRMRSGRRGAGGTSTGRPGRPSRRGSG
jgi:hypothetical protein